jgi:transposase
MNARERMDILAAYREAGSYRGAAAICGTTHKTVRRVVEQHNAGGAAPGRKGRGRNYDGVRALVTERVRASHGRISAKRLLPAARAAGYEGSARNFRRLVAGVKAAWRAGHHRGRRPAVWTPGDTLVIDWGSEARLHVFCAVLAWSRFRFVRFAADEKAVTTLGLLAECLEMLGGVPKTVLADRMGCLKAGVVANVVVPTAEYVRFATHSLLTELTASTSQFTGQIRGGLTTVSARVRRRDDRAGSGGSGGAAGGRAGGDWQQVGAVPAA